MLSFRVLALSAILFPGALLCGGCGGGGSGLSGPDPNTSAGLGTLVVRFGIDGDNGVVQIERNERAFF